jgi:hypothetical protein
MPVAYSVLDQLVQPYNTAKRTIDVLCTLRTGGYGAVHAVRSRMRVVTTHSTYVTDVYTHKYA